MRRAIYLPGRIGATLPAVTTPNPVPVIHKDFISADSLLRDSIELAMQILRSGFRPTFLVGVWRGGAPVGIAVQEVLEYHGIQTDHIAIRTSSYTGIDHQAKVVRVHALNYLVSRLSFEDKLLLIDDVFDSGRSLEAVLAELKRRCRRNLAEQTRIATVYYKPGRNRSSLKPDYFVRATEDWLVFPHELQGLTREEILRNKPVGPDFFES
ncbi:MAG: hypoxanthine phosphoribosyltransferase [Proteobacteria bacterium]|nr:hypoxanthine phosphoribosyltransferase [Pseudomonadota bacterium]